MAALIREDSLPLTVESSLIWGSGGLVFVFVCEALLVVLDDC